jgi:hypothetical protein
LIVSSLFNEAGFAFAARFCEDFETFAPFFTTDDLNDAPFMCDWLAFDFPIYGHFVQSPVP